MTKFDIDVIYMNYIYECDQLWVLVIDLRILPVTSQTPSPSLPLWEGANQRSLCLVVLPSQED